MEREYATQYSELYTRHWWWRAREEAVLEVMRRRLPQNRPLRILDVGCGDGLFFDRLAEFGEVDGVESEESLVNPAGPHRSRIQTVPFDRRLQPARLYSLVLMLDVLEHLDDPAGALRHAHSLLVPGGALLVTVPAFRVLWTNHDTINHHRARYRRRTLRPLLERAGFVVLEERYWYQWTFAAKLGIRCAEKILHRRPVIPRVPPDWLNKLLYWMSRTEQKTLGALGTPFGSTLMVYCNSCQS